MHFLSQAVFFFFPMLPDYFSVHLFLTHFCISISITFPRFSFSLSVSISKGNIFCVVTLVTLQCLNYIPSKRDSFNLNWWHSAKYLTILTVFTGLHYSSLFLSRWRSTSPHFLPSDPLIVCSATFCLSRAKGPCQSPVRSPAICQTHHLYHKHLRTKVWPHCKCLLFSL